MPYSQVKAARAHLCSEACSELTELASAKKLLRKLAAHHDDNLNIILDSVPHYAQSEQSKAYEREVKAYERDMTRQGWIQVSGGSWVLQPTPLPKVCQIPQDRQERRDIRRGQAQIQAELEWEQALAAIEQSANQLHRASMDWSPSPRSATSVSLFGSSPEASGSRSSSPELNGLCDRLCQLGCSDAHESATSSCPSTCSSMPDLVSVSSVCSVPDDA